MSNFKTLMDTANWSALCTQDMEKLNHVLDKFFDKVSETNKALVDETMLWVAFAVSENITEDAAKYLVSSFDKGEHWDYATAKSVKPDGYECPAWYYMLNKVYTCLYSDTKTTEDYIDHAKDMLMMFNGNAKKYHLAMHLC